MTQILNKEMNKIENGGPGTGGEKLIVPATTNPAGVSNPSEKPAEAPAPVPVREPSVEKLEVQPEIN
jgi:hypothetical protein